MLNYSELERRRHELSAHFREWRIDSLLITALPNVRYLSGYTGSNAALLLVAGRALLFTDPRYAVQAPMESDCEVKIAKGTLLKQVGVWAKRLKLRALGFESNRISLQHFNELQESLEAVKLRPLDGPVETRRMVKSETEIECIRASVPLNSPAVEGALRQFRPEMTQTDLPAEIDYRMRLLGADGTAFETIVASGARAALPHAKPTAHPIETNQLLLIDMGATVAGYASDMSRTYSAGKLDEKRKRFYRAVLESQLAAIDTIKAGITCAQVDRTVRGVLKGFGLDKYFVHSTGHGLGLEIHERPRVGRKEKVKLEAGMVITVEPGVYEEGCAGVRIEDTVVVTAAGCEVLTPTRKELVAL